MLWNVGFGLMASLPMLTTPVITQRDGLRLHLPALVEPCRIFGAILLPSIFRHEQHTDAFEILATCRINDTVLSPCVDEM